LELHKILAESQTIASLKVSLRGEVLDCNSYGAELFETDPVGLRGKTIMDLTAPEEKLKTYERFELISKGDYPHAYTSKTYVTVNGKRIDCSLEFWTRYEDGVPLYLETLIYRKSNKSSDSGGEVERLQQRVNELHGLVSALAAQANANAAGQPAINVNVQGGQASAPVTNTDYNVQGNIDQAGGKIENNNR
jgi:PAS domain-containing protein